jgi:Lipoprotein LpqB beta-propeller domain
VARRRVLRVAGLAVAAALVASCATVPSVGQPRAVIGATGQIPQFVQLIPPVPQPDWGPDQIVQGFVAASASFAGNHAAAQKFLSPAARRTLHLGSWPVTVVNLAPGPTLTPLRPASGNGPPTLTQATLRASQVATISDIGQYVYGPARRTYHFTLVRVGGQWRINSLSPPALLLSQDSFMDVYQARNLYFWSPGYQALVPEPVFAPQQDTYAAAAASLVHALMRTSQDLGSADQHDRTWLADATQTAFRPGTTLIGDKVAIDGQTAIVNLGGAAARASPAELQRMTRQLVTTLTSTSYASPPIARHVELQINGRQPRGASQRPSPPGPPLSTGPLYYLATNGTVSALSTQNAQNGQPGRPVRNVPGHGQVPFSLIAVGSDPASGTQLLAGSAVAGKGCTVYYGPLTGTAALSSSTVPDSGGGACTSVSWDSRGDIWAVAAGDIWVLPAGGRQFLPISPPLLPGGSAADYQVLSLRVAPDAVRVALLVKVAGPKAATQVVMAAVSHLGGEFLLGTTVAVGPTLASPIALSWYDPDHLVVLARSELYSVPVNGGAPAPVAAAPAGVSSVTATGPGRIAVAGGGQVYVSTGPEQNMLPGPRGTDAAYQG